MKSLQASLALAAFIASLGGASAAEVAISSDGSRTPRASKAEAVSAPSLGSDTVGRTDVVAAGATPVGQDSFPSNGLATVAYGNARDRANPESIVGWDSRLQQRTTSYPTRAIVFIEYNGGHLCTGWMISANTVATAGHCVHTGGSSGAWRTASLYKVYPGKDGTSNPYGFCTVRRLHSNTGWTVSKSADADYGAMRLNCNIGTNTGWFGIYSLPGTGDFLNEPAIVSGYPGDKPRTHWLSADKIRTSAALRLYYRADTVGGHSGSPVWSDRSGALSANGAWAYAVHAYGANSQNMNSAPRLTQSRVNLYIGWIQQQ